MMNFTKIFSVLICFSQFSFVPAFSQNMNSPYSVYGIGDVDHRMYNRTSGMGGTGLATRSSEYLINNNPAGIAGLPRSFYVVSLPMAGRTVQYSGDSINTNNRGNRDFWVKGLTLAVKINKFWASSLGFQQFSNVNYKFVGNGDVIGSDSTYPIAYDGSGGLNDYYWTNAVSLGKHFSLGIKSSIIAGGIHQIETITNTETSSTTQTDQRDYFGDPMFEFGAIYNSSLGKKWDFSLGGKFINKTRLSTERDLTVTEDNVVVVNNSFVKNDRFYLPTTFGAGLSLVHNKRTTFAADYTFENWTSSGNVGGSGWNYVNSNRLSAGVEIARRVQQWNQTVEKSYFQFGGYFSNSYLQVNNTPINEFGITAGMGGRLTGNLLYTIAVEGGKRGTTAANLIQENFFQITISLTYRDFLLSKGKKYD